MHNPQILFNKMKEEIVYIAKRYQKGSFEVNKGWKRLDIAPSLKWKRMRAAAIIASAIAISATAGIVFYQYNKPSKQETQQTTEKTISKKEVVKVIDFENTDLPTVISKIKEVYGVEILNIPDNAEDYRISLRYEGNAVDLIATINDILDTQMTVK